MNLPCFRAVLALASAFSISGDGSAPPRQSDEILDRARAAVRDPLAAGKVVRGSVYLELSRGASPLQRFQGDVSQVGGETKLVLTPSFDPHGPGGAAVPGTEIRITIRDGRVLWVANCAAEATCEEREFELKGAQEEPFCLLVPPISWQGLHFDVKASGVDPNAIFPSPFAAPRSKPEVSEAYWVLTSATQSPVAPGYVGQVQLWVSKSSDWMEQLVLTLQRREGGRQDEIIRATLCFEGLRVE